MLCQAMAQGSSNTLLTLCSEGSQLPTLFSKLRTGSFQELRGTRPVPKAIKTKDWGSLCTCPSSRLPSAQAHLSPSGWQSARYGAHAHAPFIRWWKINLGPKDPVQPPPSSFTLQRSPNEEKHSLSRKPKATDHRIVPHLKHWRPARLWSE